MEEGLEEMKMHLASFIVNLKDYKEERTLGKGAYGKVYLATNAKNGQKYAVKELFIEHLEGRQLKLFCREVQILAKCHNMFLLPLHGFTLTHPYSIVTEYISNGSLYEALRHRPASPTLTPTNKTIIAMGIAHGMCHLHDLNIIHRDLKSLNILLDQNSYPMICDFGIARFKTDQNQPVTQQIGTPHWMAPELFEGGKYDSRVDVYAYGIILWEMLTEETPFKGRCPVQIMAAVCTMHERPMMPLNVPKQLEELVRLCWSQTPEERPTFKTIYKLFRDKKVAYEGTDFAAVDECVRQIERAEEQMRLKKGLDLPMLDDTTLPVVAELDVCEEEESLTNYQSPMFGTWLVNAMKVVTVEDAPGVLDQIVSVMPVLPTEKMEDVLVAARVMINRGSEFIEVFRNHAMFRQLPLERTDVFGTLYDLLFELTDKDPHTLSIEQLKTLLDAQSTSSRELMSLIAMMMKEKNEEVLDLLMNNWRVFINKDAGVLMLSVVNDVISEDFHRHYELQFKDMLAGAFDSQNRRLLNAAYKLLITHFDEKYVPAQISKHLRARKTAHAALIVLSMCKKLVLTERLLVGLFGIAQYKEASAMILNAALNFDYAQVIVSNAASWVSTNKMDDDTLLLLMYRLTKHRNLDMNDATLLKFCFFLDRCLSMNPVPFGVICSILKQLPKTQTAVTFCESSGFTKRYLEAAVEAGQWQAAAAFVAALRSFGFSESFKVWLDKLSTIDLETDLSSVPLVFDFADKTTDARKYVDALGSDSVVVNAIKRNHNDVIAI